MHNRKTWFVGLSVMLLAMTGIGSAAADPPTDGAKPTLKAEDLKKFILTDAAGGMVFRGDLSDYQYTSADVQRAIEVMGFTVTEPATPCTQPSKAPTLARYDYESNAFQYLDTWVRHTKGDYDSSTSGLTSYGDMSWYNTSGYTAVPYRRDDVPNGTNIKIRDLDTMNVGDSLRNDTGPVQGCITWSSGTKAEQRWRVADLDQSEFQSLHGNTRAGLLYGRTYIILRNYNP